MLGSLEAQLHANTAAIDRAEQQRIYLESLRSEYQAMQRWALGGTAPTSPIAIAEAALRDLRKQLTDFEAKYTSRHPDVDKLRDQIAGWEDLRKRLEKENESVQTGEAPARAGPSPHEPTIAEIDSRLKAMKLEMDSYQRRAKELHERMGEVQSRLNLTPLREQQLAEVTRNYENSRQYYQSLLQKKLQSELATNLEKRQQGEQFRIIDPPNLPLKPSEPNRLEIIGIGWVLGLCVGLGLTAVLEMRDETVHNERALLQSVHLPVLVHVPVLRSRRERVRRMLSRTGEVAGVTFLLLLSVGMGVYTYLVG